MKGVDTYQGRGLIADPIHQYILYTRPEGTPGESTEQDLIDSPWMQRLRRVPQLQSARWVFPAAEHSRFQHSLGAMHLAGRFALQLHRSLQAEFADAPSAPLFEELMRVAGLLHDVGHGPFGHFFDDNFLADFDLTHEKVGQRIIREELGDLIRGLRRSPSGPFEDGERIMYYSFFSEKGLTLDRGGIQAFIMFLNARFYLYTNVYYHRTTRGIDLHLKEIFRETMKLVFPFDLNKELQPYLNMTEWTLLEEVAHWDHSDDPDRRALGREWRQVLDLLPPGLSAFPFKIDMAQQDPRPLNPIGMQDRQIYIYDAASRTVSAEPLKELLKYLPGKVAQCRIFAMSHEHDQRLAAALEQALGEDRPAHPTNL